MYFGIKEKHRIRLFTELLKVASSNEAQLTAAVTNNGWFFMQNEHFLGCFDHDKSVQIVKLKKSLFSFYTISDPKNPLLNKPFELNAADIFKTLSIYKNMIKEISFSVQMESDQYF